ncbi:hypothetical protein DAPPUDRAFT_114148 [Daphnia pulex]|uniref:Tc1-like transposase DDE domain-containing protein n=1 Tax=Daphnia pulex TaxID=6669 RepID=E9HH66_DAPPU|nr:hypothetical protein DAPPUDRAFT_114148 [Daphnia pulex]|eukprot:EFX68916.1 hypothetical protein DAPPUDRAFT_114148 [Daphnia pulex]
MFCSKVNDDIRIIREEGATRCLRNLHQYEENVTYCDTQRFRKRRAKHCACLGHDSSPAQESAICRVKGKFDSNHYKNILRQYVLPLCLSERIGLVHDWFPVHRSKAVNEFLGEHKSSIFVVDWPKSFGDIMPLEQLWLEMSLKFTEENAKLALWAVWREKSP